MSGRFIVFEGLDGSGKTTIGEAVALATNAICIASPPSEYNVLRKFICDEGDHLTRFFYFLSANYMLSGRIQKLLKHNNVICCRYIYSTIADLRYYWQPQHVGDDLRRQLERISLSLVLEPDLVIYLTCEHQERMKRIQHKIQNKTIEADNINPQYGEVVHEAYLEMAKKNWVTIDTSHRDIKNCIDVVIETLAPFSETAV